MTLRHLKIFIMVYEEMNMTIAAKKLYMTQPTVSQAIKDLEEYYDVQLFERLSQKLYVTESGKELYKYASEIISLSEEAEAMLKDKSNSKTLSVGGNHTIGVNRMGEIIEKYESEYPQVNVKVCINKAVSLKEMLRSNQLDMAIVEDSFNSSDGDLIKEFFCSDKIVAVISPKHSLAKRKSITIEEIAKEKFLVRESGVGARELFESILTKAGIGFDPYWESISATSLINAAKRNMGIGILPYASVEKEILNKELIELKFKNINLSRNLMVCYHKNKHKTEEMENFLELIIERKKCINL